MTEMVANWPGGNGPQGVGKHAVLDDRLQPLTRRSLYERDVRRQW